MVAAARNADHRSGASLRFPQCVSFLEPSNTRSMCRFNARTAPIFTALNSRRRVPSRELACFPRRLAQGHRLPVVNSFSITTAGRWISGRSVCRFHTDHFCLPLHWAVVAFWRMTWPADPVTLPSGCPKIVCRERHFDCRSKRLVLRLVKFSTSFRRAVTRRLSNNGGNYQTDKSNSRCGGYR